MTSGVRRRAESARSEPRSLATCRAALLAHKRLLAESVLAACLVELLGFAPPLAFGIVIDKVLASRAGATLTTIVAGLALAGAFEFTFRRLHGALRAELRRRLAASIDERMVARLLAAGLDPDPLAGTRRLESLRDFVLDAAESLALAAPLLLVFALAMAAFSPLLASLVLAATLAHASLVLLAMRGQRDAAREAARRRDALQVLHAEAVSGRDTLRALGAEAAFARLWSEASAAHAAVAEIARRRGALARDGSALRNRLVFALVLAIGAFELGAGAITVGGLVAFTMLLRPVSALADRLAALSSRRVEAELAARAIDAALAARSDEAPGEAGPGRLTLDDVAWRPAGAAVDVIGPVSLALAPGEILVVGGGPGSGKSTLLALMVGTLRSTRGSVHLDGVDVARPSAGVASGIALAPQEPRIFAGTIATNLRLAAPQASAAELEAACRLARLDATLARRHEGRDARLTTDAPELAASERRALALARALLAARRVLLLDDPAAGLDDAGEAAFVAAVPAIAEGRALVIATPRPLAFSGLGRTVILERGRIVPNARPEVVHRVAG